jgi:hypothetical protein
MLLNIILDARTAEDIVIEYSGITGPTRIKDDLSLQEAYIVSSEGRLILGVQMSDAYVPYSVQIQRELVV